MAAGAGLKNKLRSTAVAPRESELGQRQGCRRSRSREATATAGRRLAGVGSREWRSRARLLHRGICRHHIPPVALKAAEALLRCVSQIPLSPPQATTVVGIWSGEDRGCADWVILTTRDNSTLVLTTLRSNKKWLWAPTATSRRREPSAHMTCSTECCAVTSYAC
jgi:hypothetical protein